MNKKKKKTLLCVLHARIQWAERAEPISGHPYSAFERAWWSHARRSNILHVKWAPRYFHYLTLQPVLSHSFANTFFFFLWVFLVSFNFQYPCVSQRWEAKGGVTKRKGRKGEKKKKNITKNKPLIIISSFLLATLLQPIDPSPHHHHPFH